VNWNFQTGMHPDADQLSMFVEGATTTQEHERMLAHLAECGECRKAVFLMQPHKETQAAPATPVKGWIWLRLLPVGLPVAALACGLIAVLIYIQPGTHEALQKNASVRQPEMQLPGTPVAPTNNSETVARSANPKNSVARNAAPNLSRQEDRAMVGSILPESKSHQTAANIEPPQALAAAPAPVAQGRVVAGVPNGAVGGIGSGVGGGVSRKQASGDAAAQQSLAKKKNLPSLAVEGASHPDAMLAGVSGHITDRSGAVVPGATITLRDASGKTRQTTTSTDGSFHLTELPAGKYELTATANGFATKKQSIELKPSEFAMLQPVLDVGALSETVEVQASAAQAVATESANLGRVSPIPSGLSVVATVSHGKRFLSLDSAGNLFLSRNRGKRWKKVSPQWSGKAVQIELTPADMSEVPPTRKNETSAPANPVPLFRLTTDAGAIWTSDDGAHWHQQ
jgi:Carboxypeptidase regulatory-like domain/Putative zinc-finger